MAILSKTALPPIEAALIATGLKVVSLGILISGVCKSDPCLTTSKYYNVQVAF